MKREIKFRAWIGALSIMLYRIDVYANGNIGITTDNLPEAFWKLYHIDHDDMCIRENGTYNHMMPVLIGEEYIWFESGFELTQYAGLKDKNGVEIYEGDILECGEDKPVVVKWNNYLSSFGIKKEGWLYMHFFGEAVDPNNCTVIGNIYEHPHYLTPTTHNNEIK